MVNDYFYIAFIAVLVWIIVSLFSAYSKAIGEKEAYRARVFELTNGEEGSNLVRVKPDHYPPPPPPKDNVTTDKITIDRNSDREALRKLQEAAKALAATTESFTEVIGKHQE